MTAPATFHLVCGSTGAGKTTHRAAAGSGVRRAALLDRRLDGAAVRSGPAAEARTGRGSPSASPAARALIVETAMEAGNRGVSSVLDLGFQRADQRQRIAQQAQAAGLGRAPALHRRARRRAMAPGERPQRRSRARPIAMTVTRSMFDFIEAIWQPPSADEMAALDGVRVA